MDLNPGFGGKELLETLSQASSSRGGSAGAEAHHDTNASQHSNNSSLDSVRQRIVVDEAYRRLGKRLSAQAYGNVVPPHRLRNFRHDAAGSGFVTHTAKNSDTISPPHHKNPRTNTMNSVLHRVTVEGKERFERWYAERKANLVAGTVQEDVSMAASNDSMERRHPSPPLCASELPPVYGKGLLSVVLEARQEDSNSNTASHQQTQTHMDSTISSHPTRESGTSRTSSQSPRLATHAEEVPRVRGPCLTHPQEAPDGGRDNVEGNLIVYEHDLLSIPHVHLLVDGSKAQDGQIVSSKTHQRRDYQVLRLLGQGTFAQVFECAELSSITKRRVAVKVVKNKAAYTRQATVEIDILRSISAGDDGPKESMVSLDCYFMYEGHLCLVFELLGLNLYEVLQRRQFRGLPLTMVRTLLRQAVDGIRDLSHKNIVHCDLKPENILLVSDQAVQAVVTAGEGRKAPTVVKPSSVSMNMNEHSSSEGDSSILTDKRTNMKEAVSANHCIKIIDFGSAAFEGYTAHQYIQSRFYRSPEVLIGLPYDSSIDMWSIGCVAAELFLGLPILPGVHEHDQVCRIQEMIAKLPEWMLESGSKSHKLYVKYMPQRSTSTATMTPSPPLQATSSSGSSMTPGLQSSPGTPGTPILPQWRLKTQKEFIDSLTADEIRKKGGLAKLEKQPRNRYFKRTKLVDILLLHGQNTQGADRELLPAFVHFLYAILDPDPWKRLTAFQASQHPFITGDLRDMKKKAPQTAMDPKESNLANLELEIVWQAPWDPSLCRRKLLNVQKTRERQAARHSISRSHQEGSRGYRHRRGSDVVMSTLQRRSTDGTSSAHVGAPAQRISQLGNAPSSLDMHDTRLYPRIAYPDVPGDAMSVSYTDHPTAPATSRSWTHNMDDAGGSRGGVEDFAYLLQRPGVGRDRSLDQVSQDTPVANSMQSPHRQLRYAHDDTLTGNDLATETPVQNRNMPPPTQHGPYQQVSSLTPLMQQQAAVQGTDDASMHSTAGSAINLQFAIPQQPLSATSSTSYDINADPYGMMIQQGQFPPYQGGQPLSAQWQQPSQQYYAQPQPFVAPQQQVNGQQYSNAQQQHGVPFAVQQQPVLLAQNGGPGGGYLYITTGPNGQPMLLQPVTLMNQPSQGLYAGAPQGQQAQTVAVFPSDASVHSRPMPCAQYTPPQPPPMQQQTQAFYFTQQQQQQPQPSFQQSTPRRNKGNRFRGGTSM